MRALLLPDRLSTRTSFGDPRNLKRLLAVLLPLVLYVGGETGVRFAFVMQSDLRGSSSKLCLQVEGDMWRLEHWLEHSSATLSQLLRAGVPTSIEQLEEVIQDHREFLLQVTECSPGLMHRNCADTESRGRRVAKRDVTFLLKSESR